jgi:hypothetical protein
MQISLETTGHIAQAAPGCGVALLARVRSWADADNSPLPENLVLKRGPQAEQHPD